MKKKLCAYLRPLLVAALSGLILTSCTQKGGQPAATTDKSTEEKQVPDSTAQLPGTVNVAEYIVYDVEIINPYPDDLWTEKSLEGLDHKLLVNFVFDGIYSGEFSTFDIFEGTPIPARKLKKMENRGEFKRDQIGKFQFMETWILDTINMTYHKKVKEIRMGIPNINEHGELTGYAPLARVVL
jgi:hypothetical protein